MYEKYDPAAERRKNEQDKIKRLKQSEEQQDFLTKSIETLQKNAADAKSGDPASMLDRAAKYAVVLEGLFDYYIEQSKDRNWHDDYVAKAMTMHQQAIRTFHVWSRIEKKTSKHAERTEQNAPLDS